MAEFKVTGPDGREFKVSGEGNSDQARDHIMSQYYDKSFSDQASVVAGSFNRAIGATGLTENIIDPVLGFMGIDPVAERLSNPELMADPRFRPERAVGQTLAAGVGMAAPQLGVAKYVASAPQALQAQGVAAEVAKTVARAPMTNPILETAAIAGSSLGAGVAEEVAPNNQYARLGLEMAGAMSPTFVKAGIDRLRFTANSIGQLKTYLGGSEKEAGKRLQIILAQYGEDPGAVINALKSVKSGLTAGVGTKSKALLDLEAELIKRDETFSRDVAARNTKEMVDLNDAVTAARQTGDPRLIGEAAEVRAQHYQELLDRKFSRLEARLTEEAKRIQNSPKEQQQFSTRARKIIDSAVTAARKDEKTLWNKIDKKVRANADTLLNEVEVVKAEYLMPPEAPVSKTMENALKIIDARAQPKTVKSNILGPDGQPITFTEPGLDPTVKDLHRFYSNMRREARDASFGMNANSTNVAIYNRLADAALESISKSPANDIGVVKDAINFTRIKNDRLKRSVIGAIRNRDAGGLKTSYGETLEILTKNSGVSRGESAEALIENVAPYLGRRGSQEMAAEVESFVLSMAAKARNTDGSINANKLRDFAQDNELLLDQVPGAREIIKSTTTAQDAIDTLSSSSRDIGETIVGKLIGSENPRRVFTHALFESDRPITDLKVLMSTARRGGPRARVASGKLILESMAQNAKNGAELQQNLMTPLWRKGPKGLDYMVVKGVIGRKHADNYLKTVNELADFQAISSHQGVPVELGAQSAAVNLFARIFGANLAGFLPSAQTSTLIAGAAGSRAARNILENVPMLNVQKALLELTRDPERMAILLAKTPQPPVNGVSFGTAYQKAKDESFGIIARTMGLDVTNAQMLATTRPVREEAQKTAGEFEERLQEYLGGKTPSMIFPQ